MKRIITSALALCLAISAAGCKAQDSTPEITIPVATTAPQSLSLRTGVYTGSAVYATESFSMTWNVILDLETDGTFRLRNDAGEEKGSGTYTQDTLTYADGRTCTFIIQEDGSLMLVDPLPYGTASIDPAKVGEILLTYVGAEEDIATPDAETTATQKP